MHRHVPGKIFSVDVAHHVAVDDFHAYLVAEVVKEPDVVIAYEPHNIYAHVRHVRQLAEKADVSSWHNGSILKPIVEDVAKQVQRLTVLFEGLQHAYHLGFMLARIGDVYGAQVYIADKICFVAHRCSVVWCGHVSCVA